MSLALWKLSQTTNNRYDTFDSCVVAAYSGVEASKIHPHGEVWASRPADEEYPEWQNGGVSHYPDWANSPDEVTVRYLGLAGSEIANGEVICASFNAG